MNIRNNKGINYDCDFLFFELVLLLIRDIIWSERIEVELERNNENWESEDM